jgi:type VI secretion system protein VasD
MAASMALFALLVGCSGNRTPPAKEAQACQPANPVLAVSASDRVNSSASGQGRPVQLRLYQLKSDARLLTAKFEDVWQNDAAVLATDLVKVDEYTVYPGETKLVRVARSADAHNLAAVALFREPQGKSWYLSYELEAPKKEAPCGPSEARLAVWLDRMQIEDGQGRGSEEGKAGSKGN